MRSIPLWDDANNTLYSSHFYVKPGWSAVLFAVGLSGEKVRKSAAEFKGPQMICVEKLIYDCKFPEPKPDCCGICSHSREIEPPEAVLVADDYVETCSLPWALEPCRNIGVIGIPGVYRLHLNDATAIGTAQVYAEFHPHKAIAPQVYGAYFA